MSNCRHVIALEMPIVYTLDGDHDPDGMVLAPKAHEPLLRWARARFEDDDRRLPTLHRKRQRAQLVVDALERLEEMLKRLRHGPDEDQELLAELLRREQVPEYGEAEDRLAHGRRRPSHRAGAVRLNVQRTLDELRVALAELADDRPPDAAGPPQDLDVLDSTRIRLVSLSPQERTAWIAHWRDQTHLLDRAIAAWFTDLEADPHRRFNAARLADKSGVPRERVEQLILNDHRTPLSAPGIDRGPYDRFNPMKPLPLVEPYVLRTRRGEPVTITVENGLSRRRFGFHVQGGGMSTTDGAGVRHCDGAHIGANPDTTLAPGERLTLVHNAEHEGVWPINDLADARGSERGSNVHGLFGALVVEPPGTTWSDPTSGLTLSDTPYDAGLYVDVLVADEPVGTQAHRRFVDFHSDEVPRSFREFAVFIHDEPEIHSGLHTTGEHTVMPLSYRAEPMHNRLPHRLREQVARTRHEPDVDQVGVDRTAVCSRLGEELDEQFWTARTPEGEWLERIAGEEQHHSSWLFGEPVTPVFRAYRGDPCRVRLVHPGVKETHVWHLHVHQWRAIPQDVAPPSVHGCLPDGSPAPKGSQLLDAITIGPQTAVTIEPLYGSGSRQRSFGDVIWHCHLYPHFHHGMWGLWRSFDRLVDGRRAYPDGTPCPALRPLPGRTPEPPTEAAPGFPWFIDGDFPMKSPPPPAAVPEHRNGRRLLLGMDLASEKERTAMDPACRDGAQPGALFVDLDGLAQEANRAAAMRGPLRIVSYDVEVVSSPITYNAAGWHDPLGHHYRLLAVAVRERDPDGTERIVRPTESFRTPASVNPEPFFPRANHGDVVELRLHNALTSFPADGFDVGQAPVECGLHVHMVKFDVLAADGSATGWNYLSGASCREAVGSDHPGEQRTQSLHRWVVDEEFGPCFFHDHLLANFRQKHGLFAALIAEPHGSQWHTADDQDVTAWTGSRAVVVPPSSCGLPPFREACLAVGDFVPLLDRGGRPLNPPRTLSGDDDPGAMAVNYRNAPLTFRGDDPSLWFSSSAHSGTNLHGTRGDPDTPLLEGYPGERLRIRLIQGSHEEQHSFVVHGMRWRRDWGNPTAPLVNQQTIGISEAFTLDIDPTNGSPYGVGDHLWAFAPMDDLWVGCWGLVRVLRPTDENTSRLCPLPDLSGDPQAARHRMEVAAAAPPRPGRRGSGRFTEPVRTFVVVARRTEHLYAGHHLTDPWGLQYLVAEYDAEEERAARETGRWRPRTVVPSTDPLVLRARRGEWVRVFVVNEVVREQDVAGLAPFDVEPSPPRLPLEHLDEWGRPDRRTVSPRVSLHASLLSYDVVSSDGSFVGRNTDGTVASPRADEEDGGGHGAGGHGAGGRVVHRGGHDHAEANWTEMWWYADEFLAPTKHREGPGTACLLYDFADIRNHRHHGLVGALIVEPGDVRPFAPLASPPGPGVQGQECEAWSGAAAELRDEQGQVVAQESTVFIQDGLRLFVNGHPDLPVPDVVPGDDPEDSGHKAVSYRSGLVHRGIPRYAESEQPLSHARRGTPLWLRVLGAGDKPRQHTLTVHGLAWPFAPWVRRGPWVGSLSGVAPGWAETCVMTPEHTGDHCVRTGAFRWGTELGVWATLRVE